MPDNPQLPTDSRLKRYRSLAEMIGDADNPTPIVELRSIAPEGVEFFAKLEWMNPFGSVKDRTALGLLGGMEERGELAGKTVLEPTSGNTGIALAAIARLMGHPMVATVPHNMPAEKTVLLRALGATVIPTPVGATGDRHPMDAAIDIAEQMVAASDDYAMPNQYDNPDNPKAHYDTTGPEVWNQTDGRVRYFFAGLGTCGTISGAGRYLKERDPSVKVIAIEPVPGHKISGLKNLEETEVPDVLDRSVIDEVVYVNDAETLAMSRRLHADEVLFAGSSTAAIIAGAERWLADNDATGIAVAIAPDSSQKAIGYLTQMLGD